MTIKEVVDEIEKLCKDNQVTIYGIAGRVESDGKLGVLSFIPPNKPIIEFLGKGLARHTQNVLNKLED